MKLQNFQIDVFTENVFGGNPACVVPLEEWLDDSLLHKIALENAVAETAFFVEEDNIYNLRWFTPEIEMDLCGHATIASAHALKSILGFSGDIIRFNTKSGDLSVTYDQDLYTMNLPSRKPVKAELPEIIEKSLSKQPKEILKSRDYVLVYENEDDVRKIEINRQILDQINLDPGGVIITAKGEHCDFVSRFFTLQASIFEDPVTGSAHCSLIPYWSERLSKKEMEALQLSERTGKIFCNDLGERVLVGGHARTYSIGEIFI